VLAGKRGLTVKALEEIAQYFGIDVQTLVGELPPVADVTAAPRRNLEDIAWLRRRIAHLERELAIAIADRNFARQVLAMAEARPADDA
jgi:hypothetical protein